MVLATDLFHMMDDPGGPSHVNFDEPVATFDARYVLAGGGSNWSVAGNILQPLVNGDGVLIDVPTTDREALVLQTTDDNTTKNLFETRASDATPSTVITAAGNIELPTTTSAVGQVLQNGSRVIHTYGTNSIYIGEDAGNFSLTGADNCALGKGALESLTSGFSLIAIGWEALNLMTTGNKNIAIGRRSMLGSIAGTGNVAIGYHSLRGASGNNNFALGSEALEANTGSGNVAIGKAAMQYNTTGGSNVSIGSSALLLNEQGNYNVCIGLFAGRGTGTHNKYSNVMIGWECGRNSMAAFGNVMIGREAGHDVTDGDNNILMGYRAGDKITTGSSNIIIGYDIDSSAVGASNELNIGDVLFGTLTANQNITINALTVSADYDLMLAGDGVLGLKETATPNADANYGKVYCKNDDKLYFQDGAGAEHEIAFV